jgi:hypothetical protein
MNLNRKSANDIMKFYETKEIVKIGKRQKDFKFLQNVEKNLD